MNVVMLILALLQTQNQQAPTGVSLLNCCSNSVSFTHLGTGPVPISNWEYFQS